MTRNRRKRQNAHAAHRTVRSRLSLEQLDARTLMSATPPSEMAAEPTLAVVAQVDDSLDDLIQDQTASPRAQAGPAGGGDTALPNPEDDDDIGPWGPWVHEGLTAMSRQLTERILQETPVTAMSGGSVGQPNPDDDTEWPPGIGPLIKTADQLYLVVSRDVLAQLNRDQLRTTLAEHVQQSMQAQLMQYAGADRLGMVDWTAIAQQSPGLGLGDAGYPAPDDDDDWGPIGPWVHEGLGHLSHSFAERLQQDLQMMAMSRGGGAGQPNPEDDSPWPPGIGPLIKTTDELFAVVATDVLQRLADSDPSEVGFQQILAHVSRQLQALNGGSDEILITRGNLPGDSNHDDRFDSNDLIHVLAAGKYDDGIAHNAVFEEGDWNDDGDFDSNDFIHVMSIGHYELDLESIRDINNHHREILL